MNGTRGQVINERKRGLTVVEFLFNNKLVYFLLKEINFPQPPQDGLKEN